MPIQYRQPSLTVNSVLGNKCFAYSTLNALSNSGVATPNITNQLQADAWIKSQSTFVSTGGGPGIVLKALALTPKEYAVKYTDKILNRAKYATLNNLPTIIATTVGGLNHWIFFIGVSGSNILAEDQQNPARGVLSFTPNASGVYTATAGTVSYTLNSITIFITISAQRDALDTM